MAAKEVCGGRWCERGPGGISEGLGEFVVLRRRVGPWSDSTVGLVSRLPSRMCWVGVLCCGISFLGRLGAGDASCWHEVLRRGAVLLASRTQRAFVAFVGERRRSAAGARHDFSRAVRRVARRDVVDALVGEVWCRAGLRLRPPDSEATACSGPRRLWHRLMRVDG